jgi:hypothetical protein
MSYTVASEESKKSTREEVRGVEGEEKRLFLVIN